jgi:hypothetical protein
MSYTLNLKTIKRVLEQKTDSQILELLLFSKELDAPVLKLLNEIVLKRGISFNEIADYKTRHLNIRKSRKKEPPLYKPADSVIKAFKMVASHGLFLSTIIPLLNPKNRI